jgi:predicted MFS family arabinose efflux permease
MRENRISKGNAAATKLVMLLAAFVAMLNETSITVALSDLMRIFGVSVSTVQWLVTGFMLVTAVIVPITAYIIQRFQDRAIFFFSLALLFVGAFMAGLAPSFAFLLAARLVQAAGTCCIWALTINTMLALSTNESRGGALGLIGLVSVFAPALAPSLAGIVFQAFGWRWIFLGMAPLFLALGIFAYLRLENTTPTSKQALDPASVLLVAASFGALIYGVTGIGAADQAGGESPPSSPSRQGPSRSPYSSSASSGSRSPCSTSGSSRSRCLRSGWSWSFSAT